MYQLDEEPGIAEEQFEQYQCIVQTVCNSAGVSADQLLQILRTIPDDAVVAPCGDAAKRLGDGAQTGGSADLVAQRAAIVTACQGLGIKPSLMADIAQRVVAMAVIVSFLDRRVDLLPAHTTHRPRRQRLETPSDYMAAHWPEIHEWLTFPRGLGVWSSVVIATCAAQPLPAVVLGIVLCVLANVLAIPLWEAGHKEGGLRAVYGEARWWWKSSRPLRLVVAHWGCRWLGVAVCLLAAWSRGVTFDGWWLPLALLLTYDVVRTLLTAENAPSGEQCSPNQSRTQV